MTSVIIDAERPADAPQSTLSGAADRAARIRRRGTLVRRALAVGDALGLTFAFMVSLWLFAGDGTPGGVDRVDRQAEALLFLLTLPGWIVGAKLYGLYDRDEERTDHSTADDFGGVFHMITAGAWVLFAGAWLTGLAYPELDKLAGFWAFGIVFVCAARAGARAYCRRQPAYLQNTVVVGTCDVARLLAQKYARHPEYGINLVGVVDAKPATPNGIEALRLLGSPAELPALVQELHVERVVFAAPDDDSRETLDLIRKLNHANVQVDVVPRLRQIVGPRAEVHTVEGLPLVGVPPARLSRSSAALKRAFDLVLSAVCLVVLLPLFLVVALAIKLDSRGPVFFRQLRVGRDDRSFQMFKFRSMVIDADASKPLVAHLNIHARNGDGRLFKAADDPRTTRVGRVLRRFSLDELPQLLNVVAGHMSLVGPRPLILDEDCAVADWARRRLDLKPGITGLWQVTGNATSFEEMVALDYHYVTSWSLFGDVKLLARTLPAIARGREAY